MVVGKYLHKVESPQVSFLKSLLRVDQCATCCEKILKPLTKIFLMLKLAILQSNYKRGNLCVCMSIQAGL